MKKEAFSLKRFSLLFLILGVICSGLSLGISWGVSGTEAYLEFIDILNVAGMTLIGLGLIAGAIAIRDQIYGFSKTRQARSGANAILVSLLFIGIVVMSNYVLYRHDMRWDLTENKSFSLSDQTQKILKNLDQEVKVTAFFSSSNISGQETLNLLESYQYQNPEKFKLEIVDPNLDPMRTLSYEVKSDGTTIFEKGKIREQVSGNQEQDFTNALLRVSKENQPKIYVLEGHGELDPENFDALKGMSTIKQVLEKENYKVEKFSLLSGSVPDDASAVVIPGPNTPLMEQERKALKAYIDRHGRLLVMLQPQVQTGLEGLLGTLGVEVGNDIVIEPALNVNRNPSIPAIVNYQYHEITKEMGGATTFFPEARSVSFSQNPPQDTVGIELTKTSPMSWAEKDLNKLPESNRDATDKQGPVSLSVALTIKQAPDSKPDEKKDEPAADEPPKADPEARLVVIGNSRFAANEFMRFRTGNLDFLLNSLAWLTEQEDLISIRKAPPEQRQLQLTNQQQSLVFYSSVVGMPIGFLFLGAFIWWRRR